MARKIASTSKKPAGVVQLRNATSGLADGSSIATALLQAGAPNGARHGRARRTLLASTAFAGGVLALMMGNPQTAFAGCAVAAFDVSCATTTTTNTTFPTNPPNDRNYPGVGVFAGTMEVLSGAVITGNGLAVSVPLTSTIAVTNSGIVSVTAGNTPSAGGADVFDITSAGGAITYDGNGSVIDNGGGAGVGNGLNISNTGGGNIVIGGVTALTGNYSSGANGGAGTALNAVTSGAGNITATITSGTYTTLGTFGQAIAFSGAANVIATVGAATLVNGTGAPNNVFGYDIFGGANVTLSSAATIGSAAAPFNAGIVVLETGNVTVTQTGNVTVGGGPTLVGGPVGIVVEAAGNTTINFGNATAAPTMTVTKTGGTSFGIFTNGAASGKTGTVNIFGTIDPPDVGSSNEQLVAGANSVTNVMAGASITANDIGVLGSSTGAGNTTVTTAVGSTINQGTNGGVQNGAVAGNLGGIVTSTTAGFNSISNAATIDAAAFGIAATSTTGNIFVFGSGNITADATLAGPLHPGGSTGIFASALNVAAGGTSGNVTVGNATSPYSGNIVSGAGFPGAGGSFGIAASSFEVGAGATTAGNVLVVTSGNISVGSAGSDGIIGESLVSSATGTAGNVAVSVTAGTVTGQTNGIEAAVVNTSGVAVATPAEPTAAVAFFPTVNVSGGGKGGNVTVSTTAGTNIQGNTSDGILADTNTTNGSVTVNAQGNVAFVVGVPGPEAEGLRGIDAEINNIANPSAVTVTAAGLVSGGFLGAGATGIGYSYTGGVSTALNGLGQGILAYTAGTGAVSVSTTASSTINSNTDDAILAYTDNTSSVAPVSVSFAGNITAGGAFADGIHATTFGVGNVTVTTAAASAIGAVGAPVGHDGINASILGSVAPGGTAGNVTVTTGAASTINAKNNGITVFANADAGNATSAKGIITSNLNVTTGGNSTITVGNTGILASLTTLLANPNQTNFANINITTGNGSTITTTSATAPGDGIYASLGCSTDPAGGAPSGLHFNTGNITVTTGTGSTITTGTGGNGIDVEDFTLGPDSGTLTVTLGNNTTITSGNNAVLVGQHDLLAINPVIVNVGGNGFLQLSATNGGSGINAFNFGDGGVSVQAGTAACANTMANCNISVTKGTGAFAGEGILAFTTSTTGAVTVYNFAQIDPTDAIYAEIANPLNPSPVAVQNNATISGTRTGIVAATDGLGSVTVTDGNIIAGTSVTGGTNGIYAVATNLLNASAVTISVNGSVQGNGTAAVPAYTSAVFPFANPFRAGVPGVLAAYPNATTVAQPLTASGAAGYAIFAYNAGVGGVTVNVYGPATSTITSTGGAGVGILAYSDNPNLGNTGNISVSSSEPIVVPAAAPASGFGNTGIIAYTAGTGNVNVATTASGTIGSNATGTAAAGGNGIEALIAQTGSTANINVNALGTIDATGVDIAYSAFTGSAVGPAQASFGAGIVAINLGSGNVSVTSGAITTPDFGINAAADNASAPATSAGTVTVNALGNITAGSGLDLGFPIAGILALSGNTATPGMGNIFVNTSASVSGGIGIEAITSLTGTVTIGTDGGPASTITGTTGDAINVVNAGETGTVSITANSAVKGALDGIDVQTAGIVNVSGAGTISGVTAGIFERTTDTAAGDVLTVNSTGTVTATGGNAIDTALAAGQAGNIRIFAETVTAGGGGNAISATTAGTGNLIVTTDSGNVSAVGAVTSAINAVITNAASAGTITVLTGSGLVSDTAGSGTGVNAITAGTGLVSVTIGAGGVSAGIGVDAKTTSGSLFITTQGTVTGTGVGGTAAFPAVGGGDAIYASTTSGNVSILTNGAVAGTPTAGGGEGIAVSSTTGNVLVVNQNTVSGDPGIIIATGGTIVVDTFAPVTGATNGIQTAEAAANSTTITLQSGSGVTGTAGNGIISTAAGAGAITMTIDPGAPVSGGTNGISATSGGGNIAITTASNVTGGTNGIVTTDSGAGTTTILVLNPAVVTGTGAGNSGISATTSGSGLITVKASGGTTVTNATGTGITLNTFGAAAASASATLDVSGTLNALGSLANPDILVVNNTNAATGTVTINDHLTGIVKDAASNITGWAVVTSTNGGAAPSANLEPVNVNNAGNLFGRVWLGAGASTFTNNADIDGGAGGLWAVSDGAAGVGGTGAGPASQFGNGSSLINNAMGIININNNIAQGTASQGNVAGFQFSNGTGLTDTVKNLGTINASGGVNFEFVGTGATVISNTGTMNIGTNLALGLPGVTAAGSTTEWTSFSSLASGVAAPLTTGVALGGIQTVTNTGGTINVFANGTGGTGTIGTGAVTAVGPSGVGALNFIGGAGSSFINTGGVIDLAASGTTTNAMTLNTTALAGTSDLNYTYAYATAAPSYNFIGAGLSTLVVNTFLGGPGSTSDRLVVGGNVNTPNPAFPTVNPVTQILVNNANTGPGAINGTGITVVAVQGAGSNNFVVSPASPGYVNFGPLGAINVGAFVDPLIYVAGGGTTPTAVNAYKFFGVPGPFLSETPAFAHAALNIFDTTADTWYDRQEETRNCMRLGWTADVGGGGADLGGGGADLLVKAPPYVAPVCKPGVWTKLIGSYSDQKGTLDFGQINPALTGLGFDTSFRQGTGGALVGYDFGKTDVLGRGDSLVFSVMGGYITSLVNFNAPNSFMAGSPNTSLFFQGGTVAGSATYMKGGFFIDTLLKADFLTLNVGNIPANLTGAPGISGQSVNSTTWGTYDNIGYRYELGRYFFEPIGSVEWATNRIQNLNLAAAMTSVQFGDNDMLNVGGGARAGGVIMDDKVHYLEASVIGRVWDRVYENDTVNLASTAVPAAFPTTAIAENYRGVYGETGIQLDWLNRYSGWSAFMRGDLKFNNQFETLTGTMGVRYSW